VEHLLPAGAVERARVVHEWPEKGKGQAGRKPARKKEREADNEH